MGGSVGTGKTTGTHAARKGKRRSIGTGTVGTSHFRHEAAHLLAVLDSRRDFDPAGHVHRPRRGGADRVVHVVRRDPAGQHERPVQSAGDRAPVERVAGTAGCALAVAVEQETVGVRPALLQRGRIPTLAPPIGTAFSQGMRKALQNASSSSPWNCSNAGRTMRTTSRTSATVLSRNSATAPTIGASARRSCRASAALTRRGLPSANTKPTASTPSWV